MLKELIGVDVSNVHFNSKSIKPNGLFIPIKGENSDGHLYIQDAINNGAIASLWNKDIEIPKEFQEQVKFILVEDTLKSFQELALYYRESVNPIVIGVTGSNGKTTTKEFLDVVLKQKYKVHKNSGNFNNHLGVPLTLLEMPSDTEVCIVEMGMNHLGEIHILSNIAKPDYALIVNIGESHIGLLGSRENIAKAKMEIIDGTKNKQNVIFDGDEPLLQHLDGYPILNSSINHIVQNGSNLTFEYNGSNYLIPTFGIHNVKNSTFAIRLAEILNIDYELIQEGLKYFKNQPMRLEYREIENNSFLLDCYNASLTSIISALDTLDNIRTDKKKIAVLGDVFELGKENDWTHKEIGKQSSNYKDITFWFVGDSMRLAFQDFKKYNSSAIYFPSKKELFDYTLDEKILFNNHYFLLKASRGMKLEDFFNHFQSR